MSPFLVYRMGDIARLPEAEVRPVGRALVIPGSGSVGGSAGFVSLLCTPLSLVMGFLFASRIALCAELH